MRIAVIGTGYVGLVTGACFAEFGVDVTCVDIDEEKIGGLLRGEIPIYEPGLDALVKRNIAAGRLNFTNSTPEAMNGAEVVFLAVGTPPKDDGSPDMSFYEAAALEIAQNLDSYIVLVTKSTVPVGTGKWLRDFVKSNSSREIEFGVASNPEFLREGAAISDFMRPDRVVIGSDDPKAIEVMRELYRPLYLIETPIVITSPIRSTRKETRMSAILHTTFICSSCVFCSRLKRSDNWIAVEICPRKLIKPFT